MRETVVFYSDWSWKASPFRIFSSKDLKEAREHSILSVWRSGLSRQREQKMPRPYSRGTVAAPGERKSAWL